MSRRKREASPSDYASYDDDDIFDNTMPPNRGPRPGTDREIAILNGFPVHIRPISYSAHEIKTFLFSTAVLAMLCDFCCAVRNKAGWKDCPNRCAFCGGTHRDKDGQNRRCHLAPHDWYHTTMRSSDWENHHEGPMYGFLPTKENEARFEMIRKAVPALGPRMPTPQEMKRLLDRYNHVASRKRVRRDGTTDDRHAHRHIDSPPVPQAARPAPRVDCTPMFDPPVPTPMPMQPPYPGYHGQWHMTPYGPMMSPPGYPQPYSGYPPLFSGHATPNASGFNAMVMDPAYSQLRTPPAAQPTPTRNSAQEQGFKITGTAFAARAGERKQHAVSQTPNRESDPDMLLQAELILRRTVDSGSRLRPGPGYSRPRPGHSTAGPPRQPASTVVPSLRPVSRPRPAPHAPTTRPPVRPPPRPMSVPSQTSTRPPHRPMSASPRNPQSIPSSHAGGVHPSLQKAKRPLPAPHSTTGSTKPEEGSGPIQRGPSQGHRP